MDITLDDRDSHVNFQIGPDRCLTNMANRVLWCHQMSEVPSTSGSILKSMVRLLNVWYTSLLPFYHSTTPTASLFDFNTMYIPIFTFELPALPPAKLHRSFSFIFWHSDPLVSYVPVQGVRTSVRRRIIGHLQLWSQKHIKCTWLTSHTSAIIVIPSHMLTCGSASIHFSVLLDQLLQLSRRTHMIFKYAKTESHLN